MSKIYFKDIYAEDFIQEEIIGFNVLDKAIKYIEENSKFKISEFTICRGQKKFNAGFDVDKIIT